MTKPQQKNKGNWFKIHRDIFDNQMWLSEPFTKSQAWIDIIGNANHKDGVFWVRGIKIEVKRGQIAWSELTMMKRWKWGRKKVRNFISYLKKEQQIKHDTIYKITTIISIINYNKYQDDTTKGTTEDTTEEQQRNNRGNTNKKVKKEKNIIGEQSSHELQSNTKPMTYEEPSIDIDTGELIQGTRQDVRRVKDKESIYQLFSNTKQPWMFHKQQREAALRLFDLKGLEQVKRAVAFMKQNSSDKFCPQAQTPFRLEEKWDALLAYRNRV